jgi:hypothetical protein
MIGNQLEGGWAFDAVGYKSESDPSMLIACEVKKSRKEIDALISHMQSFGLQPPLSSEQLEQLNKTEKNAYRKVKALRERNASTFWAVGPERYEKVFSVDYREEEVIEFEPISSQALMHK